MRAYVTSRGTTGVSFGFLATVLVVLLIIPFAVLALAAILLAVTVFVVVVLAMHAVEIGDRGAEHLSRRYAARRAARPLHWPGTVIGAMDELRDAGRSHAHRPHLDRSR